jgi:sugar phosphate isomerase/epimerase
MNRRHFLGAAAALAQAQTPPADWTKFQLACMTLPYSPFPFARALEGIRGAGYQHVAWGTSHPDPATGKPKPLLDWREPASRAKELAKQTRDAGLEPVMMFAMVNIESPDGPAAHASRVEQAAAAGIPYVLTFGHTQPGKFEGAIATLKSAGPLARKAGVQVLIKQHGGNTATGADCARIIAEVADEGVRMCYDAGNVMDYEGTDPIPDIAKVWRDIRAFCIKDHRDHPKDQDCGPGFGEIDHYKLLSYVMRTGRTMPLAFENIFAPLVPRPRTPDGVDKMALRAREYVETVIEGLKAGG